MSDQSLLERQLERYRKLLFGATDPLLVEGLRKLIAELEGRLEPPLEQETAPLVSETESELLKSVS